MDPVEALCRRSDDRDGSVLMRLHFEAVVRAIWTTKAHDEWLDPQTKVQIDKRAFKIDSDRI